MITRLGETLIWVTIALLSLGVVMVTSTSMPIAMQSAGDPFYFVMRQLIFLVIGLVAAGLVYHVPLSAINRHARWILLAAVVCLLLLFIPGLGRSVNGSLRWLSLGPVHIQVSELAKLGLIIYFSHYCAQYSERLRAGELRGWAGLLPLLLVAGLLLLQPDFGSVLVITVCVLGLFFLMGAPLWQFVLLTLCAVAALAGLAIMEPYRFARLTTFLNPWAHPFDAGYQLTQALIAIGQGQWLGLGLGLGVQKLFYLPEAHTDFIFAILAEELGFIGAVGVVGLYGIFAWAGFSLSRRAFKAGQGFSGCLAFGITLWLCLQALIAMGVNVGLLPTKGLTLPFISAGGSSLVVCLMAIALLLRIDRGVAGE